MDENESAQVDEEKSSEKSGLRFVLLVVLSIILSFVLVSVSLIIYTKNGAAQLDLSRPGYNEVRSKVDKVDDSAKSYPVSGPINDETVEDFISLFNEQSQKIKTANAFSTDPLSPESLGLVEVITTDSIVTD